MADPTPSTPPHDEPGHEPAAAALAARFHDVRGASERLCEPLELEDYGVQSMPEASPIKWHLAHTSWFFETFVLEAADPAAPPFDPRYRALFNSYYDSVGPRHPRERRGLLSRPSVAEVLGYRAHVDARVLDWLESGRSTAAQRALLVIGLEHEQQHQELMLTDIKHAFSCSPLRPAYRTRSTAATTAAAPAQWIPHPGGIARIGHDGAGFCFDNEGPRHRVILAPFELASALVTSAQWLEFIEAGGYRRPELWLSDGWATRQRLGWTAPAYWERAPSGWRVMTLDGMRDLDGDVPVCHVSYYEADAYARWRGARLPTEQEWELAAAPAPVRGNFVESEWLHPQPAAGPADAPRQLFGDVWEWTASPYVAYPGYRAPAGALGEYNGKFMCNQMVLRGGSCVSPRAHLRASYRNFFPPEARWQFSGLRLARDA